ncbi:MAG: hypothetical protein V3T28_09245 [Gemmatimonadales bacterium]
MTTIAPDSPTGARSADTNRVTEREARAVAEAAREKEWAKPSFVRELFNGRLLLHLVHPYPEVIDPDEEQRAAVWLERVEKFMKERVDADQIDRDRKIPQHVIDGLKELGAFGI